MLLNFRARYMADVALAFIQFVDFIGIGIETDHSVARFRKTQTER